VQGSLVETQGNNSTMLVAFHSFILCVRLGAGLLIFHMGSWGFFTLAEAKQRNVNISEKQKDTPGTPLLISL